MAQEQPAIIAIEFGDHGDASKCEKRSAHESQEVSRRHYLSPLHLRNFEGRPLDEVDGCGLAWFSGVAQAVRYAEYVLSQFNDLDVDTPLAGQRPLKIGVTGFDPIGNRGLPSSDDIKVAVQMMEAAEPGGLCLSRTAYDVVKFTSKLPFDDRSDPAHTAYQCGEIRKKYHSMDLVRMSAVKVGPEAFRRQDEHKGRLSRSSNDVSRLLQKIALHLGLSARRDDTSNKNDR